MAITAEITIAATGTAQIPVGATCTVTNGNAEAVSVQSITPYATIASDASRNVPVALGVPNFGPGAVVSVAGSDGTRAFSFGVVAFKAGAYDIGAVVKTSDGSLIYATTDSITIS